MLKDVNSNKFIRQLDEDKQECIRDLIKKGLLEDYDLNEVELISHIEKGMSSRICDIQETVNIHELSKILERD